MFSLYSNTHSLDFISFSHKEYHFWLLPIPPKHCIHLKLGLGCCPPSAPLMRWMRPTGNLPLSMRQSVEWVGGCLNCGNTGWFVRAGREPECRKGEAGRADGYPIITSTSLHSPPLVRRLSSSACSYFQPAQPLSPIFLGPTKVRPSEYLFRISNRHRRIS